MKILIVEDDFVSRKVLERYLGKYGQCSVTTNAADGLDHFRQAMEAGEPYAAVFMDILMPGMDGQEAVKRLRAMEEEHKVDIEKAAKVVMATALDDPENVRTAFFRNHVDAYMVKPFTMAKIKDAMVKAGLESEE